MHIAHQASVTNMPVTWRSTNAPEDWVCRWPQTILIFFYRFIILSIFLFLAVAMQLSPLSSNRPFALRICLCHGWLYVDKCPCFTEYTWPFTWHHTVVVACSFPSDRYAVLAISESVSIHFRGRHLCRTELWNRRARVKPSKFGKLLANFLTLDYRLKYFSCV